jgi:fucose permease
LCGLAYKVSFFLLGYGAAMTLALNNVFCANLHPPSAVLGAAHGSYGVGGIVAPIVATTMVSSGIVWSRFYLMPLGLACFALAFAGWAFWDYEEHTVETTSEHAETRTEAVTTMQDLERALKNRVTIIGALFVFAYQGAEVAISGWMISFLINYRDGDPASVGYVTAGFWVSGDFPILCHQAEFTRILMSNRAVSR